LSLKGREAGGRALPRLAVSEAAATRSACLDSREEKPVRVLDPAAADWAA
jgi:hypothetical protein